MTRWSSSVQPRERRPVDRHGRGAERLVDAVEARLDGPAGLRARAPGTRRVTARSSVPVVRSSARPAIDADVGQVDVAPVAYRKTGRLIPPCHHWSWSSTYVASDHLTTRRRQRVRARPEAVGQVELGGEVRVLADADLVAVEARRCSTLSAAPTWSTIAPAGPVRGHLEFALVDAGRVRARGSSGGRPANGIWTLV